MDNKKRKREGDGGEEKQLKAGKQKQHTATTSSLPSGKVAQTTKSKESSTVIKGEKGKDKAVTGTSKAAAPVESTAKSSKSIADIFAKGLKEREAKRKVSLSTTTADYCRNGLKLTLTF
jgi:hypothetical protein